MPLLTGEMEAPLSPTPLSPGAYQVSSAGAPAAAAAVQRQSMASIRPNHSRTQSRFADSASRVSDEEGSRTAVKVGQYHNLNSS